MQRKLQSVLIISVTILFSQNCLATPSTNTAAHGYWKLVATLKSSGTAPNVKTSQTFVVGPVWLLDYTTGTGKYDGLGRWDRKEITHAYLCVGKQLNTTLFEQQASGSHRGIETHPGAGKYNMVILSNQPYTVRVYDHRN